MHKSNSRNQLQSHHLHIVCLDVPYPVDYGGVFDLFYKIKSLSEAGIKIHLHCFEYGRGQQEELNKYCVDVHYYHRRTGHKGFSVCLPYIVASRANTELLKNLTSDDHPVLLEGIHCTYFLSSGDLAGKKVFVRLHNVEYLYYQQLGNSTSSWLKKIFYQRESRLLKSYEASLKDKATFWTVNDKDLDVFSNEFGYRSIQNLPPFMPEYEPEWTGGKGSYCLYHGNLSVVENEKAALWLTENIFSELPIPLVIAGKNPSDHLLRMARRQKHICVVENPGDTEMQELIKKAQVNILPSFNSTGIKLKLINALYNGKHCLVNTAAAEGTGLECCCTIADCTADMKAALQKLYDHSFTLYQFEHRQEHLKTIFSNRANAEKMIGWIFG
ncbi:MAG: glycosyltransferase family 4 protein [Bacteroidota bacterium]